MADAIGVARGGVVSADELAARSRDALVRPLAADAELWVARAAGGEARVLGAFQRLTVADAAHEVVRRGSGGPEVRVGVDTVHVLLALARCDALVACDATRIVNRYVRPLLRALTKLGAQASYFGRDWVSVRGRPAAMVLFAHDAGTGRAVLEAFIGLRTPIAEAGRASFMGKEPVALAAVDAATLEDAVVEAYASAYGREARATTWDDARGAGVAAVEIDPPWRATREEPIGVLGAGPDREGRFRVGGDWLVSADAVTDLEARIAAGEDPVTATRAALAARGVALDGVRSVDGVAELVARARGGVTAP